METGREICSKLNSASVDELGSKGAPNKHTAALASIACMWLATEEVNMQNESEPSGLLRAAKNHTTNVSATALSEAVHFYGRMFFLMAAMRRLVVLCKKSPALWDPEA